MKVYVVLHNWFNTVDWAYGSATVGAFLSEEKAMAYINSHPIAHGESDDLEGESYTLEVWEDDKCLHTADFDEEEEEE